jgi:putative aldouronate transport system substrate-binding protein
MAAVLTALVMLMTLFAACNRGTTGAAGGDVFERMRNTTYEVKLFFTGWDTQPDQDMVFKAFNDKLTEMGYPGLTVRFDGCDWGSFGEKGNALILSGGDYDMCYAPTWAGYYTDAMAGGAWLDWTPYIKLVPEYYAYQEEYLEYLYSYAADGVTKQIIFMPGIKEHNSFPCEIRWNKTVANKLGITEAMYNVKTLRDLDPYLEMYKNAYPNNGMAVLAVDAGGAISSYFDVGFSWGGVWFNTKTDRYEVGATSPYFDQLIDVFREWRAKGYIPAYEQTELHQDLITKFGPESFLVYFNMGKYGDEAEYNQSAPTLYGFEFGTTFITQSFMTIGDLLGVPWAINARSRNPEAAAFVFQLLATNKELTNLIHLGIPGVHYNLDETGTVRMVQPQRYFSNIPWMFGNRFELHRLPGEPENLGALYLQGNRNALRPGNFAFTWPPESAFGNFNIDAMSGVIGSLAVQYGRSIETGTLTDAEKADIRSKLQQVNIQGYADILNREYEAFKASRR